MPRLKQSTNAAHPAAAAVRPIRAVEAGICGRKLPGTAFRSPGGEFNVVSRRFAPDTDAVTCVPDDSVDRAEALVAGSPDDEDHDPAACDWYACAGSEKVVAETTSNKASRAARIALLSSVTTPSR
ncbi:hypothetical protein Lesp01_83060 [Lentzea sp. NBRC 102530]|nr:hypothetical protein Lesp01_83060 [Lentzea sp. NBRC 102530]